MFHEDTHCALVVVTCVGNFAGSLLRNAAFLLLDTFCSRHASLLSPCQHVGSDDVSKRSLNVRKEET